MKKTRFIALVLVAAVMLIGAGYAAWTDQLTITNTVNTGYLDVFFVIGEGTEILEVSDYVEAYVTYDYDTGEGVDNGPDIANVIINNMYPGAEVFVELTIENDSTIPVIVDPYGFTSNFGSALTVEAYELSYTDIYGNSRVVTSPSEDPFTSYYKTTITVKYKIVATDAAEEDTTYTMNVNALVKQFNQ